MSVELQTSQLWIGEWLIEPELDQISRAGETFKLEPRTMRLLMRLADAPGEVVSSKLLLDEVWPGVVVGSASLYQAISQLRKLLGDVEAAPSYIATIPRKGYRLIAPVRAPVPPPPATALASTELSPPAPSETAPRRGRFTPRRAWAVALLPVAIAVLLAVTLWRGSEPADSQVASIVVLPFVDLSDGERDGAFCDGLTEELASTLSQLPALRVVARTSAYAFRDRPMDVREIGRKLSATHVLEGSVRRSGDAVRVTARLVDARQGFRSWSESYDLPAKEVLSLQSDIARSVAKALELRFPQETATRIAARASSSTEAYELYLLGRHHFRQRTPEANAKAIELNSRAIALDPEFVLAYAALAQAKLNQDPLGQQPMHELQGEVERLIEKALALDPGLADAYAARGALRQEQNRLASAKEDLRHAISLNASNVQAVVNLGRVFESEGLLRPALEQFTRARLLDPLDFMRHVQRCITLQDLGGYADASVDCAEGARLQPQSEWGFMAMSWGARAQGRLAEALQWNDKALRVAPRSVELHLQRTDMLLDLHLLGDARDALDRSLVAAGEDPRVRIRYADLLLVDEGPAAARQFIDNLPLDASVGAGYLMIAAQTCLAAGDEQRARQLAERALAAPDFDSLKSSQRAHATWGVSYQLPLALLARRSGDEQASMQRAAELLALLDEMERNGYASWGLHALRAQAYGFMGDPDRAVRSLRRAVQSGWRSAWSAQHDPFLAPLVHRADFGELMREVETFNLAERTRYSQVNGEVIAG